MKSVIHVGIDVGSTTVKAVVVSPFLKLLFGRYVRHLSNVRECALSLLDELREKFPAARITAAISGSGGIGLAQALQLPFVQEILAETKAIRTYHPETDVIIELGGEDAKVTYLRDGADQRMNGACAGGTGAFIDRMASLLSTDAAGLNAMAEQARQIYPIASRCGVFAKTDIQALLNEGAPHTDIAASVFQSVVNQTLTGLTCGKPVRGKTAFLGGPLTFLPALRRRFQETLHLKDEDMIVPDHGELYVAMGTAITARHDQPFELDPWLETLHRLPPERPSAAHSLAPLFASPEEYQTFKKRHSQFHAPSEDLSTASGPCWLGIDAGSTTIKAVLIDRESRILYRWYGSNQGKPLDGARNILTELYGKLPESVRLCGAGITGYGEGLLKAALCADTGEVETISHYRAARHFCPDVTAILDIGGQDIKCCRIRGGAIDTILLNESCSSGCGSFLDTFAQSLQMNIRQFAQLALTSSHPADLGTRCTVFMNSRVREAQKNGASAADLSAGLSYSVIRNALHKVIRLRHASDLGDHVVVQGGTFCNDAVLRAFEKLLGQDVVRPDISDIMGAFGIALIARERCGADHVSSLLSPRALAALSVKTGIHRCPGCGNRCLVTVSSFSDGRAFLSGNRCERGASLALTGKTAPKSCLPNMYSWKYERLFSYTPLPASSAPKGSVGIPRVMNLYEDYPFWFTFFTRLGYRVILSSPSVRSLSREAIETIPSDSECFPVKLAHAHILDLIRRKPDRIWYPCIDRGPEETGCASQYHCPMVTSYPEVIAANMDGPLQAAGVPFCHPFLPLHSKGRLVQRLCEELSDWGLESKEIRRAAEAACQEMKRYREDLLTETKRVLDRIHAEHLRGIVLAGRPYHGDPAVHHGIPDLINQLGMAVLSEDGIAMLEPAAPELRVLNQWSWHSRLYKAAAYVISHPELELVELNSFGCGLDAVVTDQVQELLSARHRLYTSLKIDEGLNLGAVRIRLRSLAAAVEERKKQSLPKGEDYSCPRPVFTKDRKAIDTILVPEMSPLHFPMIEAAVRSEGYRLSVVKPSQSSIDKGLSFVNNDACYPAVITIGSLIDALLSGQYDLNKTALMISQTGGACRASNYLALLRKALIDSGLGFIPIVSANTASLEKQPGFTLSPGLLRKLVMAILLGDTIMRCLYRTRPYESTPGSANALCQSWQERCTAVMNALSFPKFSQCAAQIVSDFDRLPLREDQPRLPIGIVGEIYVKFHPLASNDIVSAIEENGGEAAASGLLDFFLYSLLDSRFQHRSLDGSWLREAVDAAAVRILEWYRRPCDQALRQSCRFYPFSPIQDMADKAARFLSLGHRAGEGWFLTADTVDLLSHGCRGIVCLQPFGCLPNHITGKGMIHRLRTAFPQASFLTLDCDAGASQVNQLNRLKLMMNSLLETDPPTAPELPRKRDVVI